MKIALKMTAKNHPFILAVGLILAACGSTKIDKVAEYPPREDNCILDIYDNERQLPQAFSPVC